MNDSRFLRVLWPRQPHLRSYEERYSREFCRGQTRRLCAGLVSEKNWIDYDPETRPAEVLGRIDSDRFLLVTDPLVVICPEVLVQLHEAVWAGFDACGPVFNESAHEPQKAEIPAPYFNLGTYLTAVRRFAAAQNRKPVSCDRLDPGCLMLRRSAMAPVGAMESLAHAPDYIRGPMAIVPGALVHRFAHTCDSARQELVELIPADVLRILDIGCACGGYGRSVKASRPDIYVAGVEISPEMAEESRPFYDSVYTCSADDLRIPESEFDLVNCGDVLEHLLDPWASLKRLSGLLRPRGYLVASVPNMGHWSVIMELLRGEFQYLPSGLQFVSHIRWFTGKSIVSALADAGFEPEIVSAVKPEPDAEGAAFIREMASSGHGDEQSLETVAYHIRAIKK